jgi:hypothetical protein
MLDFDIIENRLDSRKVHHWSGGRLMLQRQNKLLHLPNINRNENLTASSEVFSKYVFYMHVLVRFFEDKLRRRDSSPH